MIRGGPRLVFLSGLATGLWCQVPACGCQRFVPGAIPRGTWVLTPATDGWGDYPSDPGVYDAIGADEVQVAITTTQVIVSYVDAAGADVAVTYDFVEPNTGPVEP